MLFSHPSTIEVLDSKDKSGRTPLMWAVAKGHRQVAEMLVARGADVNAVDIVSAAAVLFPKSSCLSESLSPSPSLSLSLSVCVCVSLSQRSPKSTS